MQPAPMTPDTLKLIRANAERLPAQQLAEQLGWTVERLQRTARERQIPLSLPATVLVPVPVAVAAPPAPPKQRHPPSEGRSNGSRLNIQADATLDEIMLLLPRRQLQIMRVLKKAKQAGVASFMTSAEIAAHVGDGLDVAAVPTTIRGISKHLRTSAWEIDSRHGHHGGFRLVERT